MTSIHMITERKGSNPGGKCVILYQGQKMDAYIKYCEQSRLPKDHPFVPKHQPIYEAVTMGLAEKLGLHTPRFGLLSNPDGNLQVTYETANAKKDSTSPRQPFYFVSKLCEVEEKEDLLQLTRMMAREKIYRDLLMIGDISGKKQNFALVSEPIPHILYIDIGCSFVDAVNGYLSQRHSVSNLTRDNKGKPRKGLKRDVRAADKYLSNFGIVTNHENEWKKDLLALDEFTESVGDLELKCIPKGCIRVGDILSEEEIIEIKSLLKLNMEQTLREYKRKEKTIDMILEL